MYMSSKIADLDPETRKVIFLAHLVASPNPSPHAMAKLRAALKEWNECHEAEREQNLLRAIFDPTDTPRD